jgi:hypothetical protein
VRWKADVHAAAFEGELVGLNATSSATASSSLIELTSSSSLSSICVGIDVGELVGILVAAESVGFIVEFMFVGSHVG